MPDKIIAELIDRIKTEWRSPIALVCLELLFLFICVVGVVWSEAKQISVPWAILAAGVAVIIAIVWLIARRPPKARKNTIGFGIAI